MTVRMLNGARRFSSGITSQSRKYLTQQKYSASLHLERPYPYSYSYSYSNSLAQCCFSTTKGDQPSEQQQPIKNDNALSAAITDTSTDTSTDTNSNTSNNATAKYVKTISELSKARLSALVVSTTTFGYLSAAPVPINYTTLACASLGTALCSSSASTLNQIFEYDRDSKMKRTSKRPLVTQDVVGLRGAIALAASTGISGGSILYLGTDNITAALGVGNIALYAGAYTFMKPRSEWNTWIGAVVGAVPPVMGYTAATNGLGLYDLEAALIGSTLLLWQFPHFFALAWMHRVDYARGGFEMVSTNDIDGHRTAALVKNYTYYLSTLPFISTLTGITSSMFAIEGLFLNGYAIYVAKNFEKERSNGNARKVFLTSLWYLPCWMILFLLHSKKWKEGVDEEDHKEQELELISYLKKKAADIREKGKEMCIHEIFIFDSPEKSQNENDSVNKKSDSKNKCPVVFGKVKAKEATEITQTTKLDTAESQK
jgi:protoheme IX farnesyltransferase